MGTAEPDNNHGSLIYTIAAILNFFSVDMLRGQMSGNVLVFCLFVSLLARVTSQSFYLRCFYPRLSDIQLIDPANLR